GAGVLRVHRLASAVDEILVKCVLHVRPLDRARREALQVRLVFGEEQLRSAARMEPALAERLVFGLDGRELRAHRAVTQARPPRDMAPRPGVAVPKSGQEMERRRLWTTVPRGDADQDVFVRRLGVF